jgi:hypothetical protein
MVLAAHALGALSCVVSGPTIAAAAQQPSLLAILDNRALNAADPAAWAPFTLIGEAGP